MPQSNFLQVVACPLSSIQIQQRRSQTSRRFSHCGPWQLLDFKELSTRHPKPRSSAVSDCPVTFLPKLGNPGNIFSSAIGNPDSKLTRSTPPWLVMASLPVTYPQNCQDLMRL